MPKYHYDILPNSEAWEQIRLGIPTASDFKRIISPTGKPSEQYEDYAYKLIAERIMKRKVDTPSSEWMLRGHELEEEAISFYELQKNIDTKVCGFVELDDKSAGCSPDRLVGEDGILEIKCPAPNTQIKYLCKKNVAKEYWPQLQGQLYITGRAWVDIISYYPTLPPSIITVKRDEVYIKCLEEFLNRFNEFMFKEILNIAKMTESYKLPHKPDAIEELLRND